MKEVICGVYKITNLENGKVYVGSSKDIYSRWNKHKSDLRRGNHHNKYLQRSFEKYGDESFEYEIILQCNDRYLSDYELATIKMFKSDNSLFGYNMNQDTKRVDNFRTLIHFDWFITIPVQLRELLLHTEISNTSVAVLFKLCSIVSDYDNAIKIKGKHPNKSELFSILGVSKNTGNKALTQLSDLGAIHMVDGVIYINPTYARGKNKNYNKEIEKYFK